jgi:hypothetical protein
MQIITPEAIRPHPKAGPRKKAQASSASAPRKRGDTKILTDTPVKRQLEDEFRNREQKKLKVASRKTVKTKLMAADLPSATRKMKQRKSKSQASDDTERCKICQFQFGNADDPKIDEDWLQCLVCYAWFHDSCAQENGLLDIGDKFTCIDCIP